MERFSTREGGHVFYARTYNGHALNCAAALATIETLEQRGAYERLFGLGDYMRAGLRDIMSRHGIRAEVAGFGSVS